MPKFKNLFNRDIHIVASANGGFVAQIGCCTMTYGRDDIDTMIADLREYLTNLCETDKNYHQIGNDF